MFSWTPEKYLLPHFQFRKVVNFVLFLLLIVFHIIIIPKIAVSSDRILQPTSPLDDSTFFPLGVWLQSPTNATRFKNIGVNLYIGLWEGPTPSQLQDLKKAGMSLICQQNTIALNTPHRNSIVGWLQQDEPDNSQKRTAGLFYNPPIDPSIVRDHYTAIRKLDPERPVILNLGQGVAWDNWKGRGTRTNHPEDYKEYVKGGDILSFDIYPVTHRHPEVKGRLEYVAHGVQRLKSLVSPQQKVWNVIGVSRVNNPEVKPTPLQVRSQVWMSIIHGSRGIIYFVHQFKPRFIEAAIFENSEMMQELTQLNGLIQSLAKVLNSPDTSDIKRVTTASPDAPVAAVTKRDSSFLYLLSVAMRNKETTGSFEFSHAIVDQDAEVLGENRRVRVSNGILEDHYRPYEPHLYKIALQPSPALK